MAKSRRRWFILAALLGVLLVGGIAGGLGVAAASDDTEDQSQAVDPEQTLLERVCAIYEENTGVPIEPEQLEKAFDQARSEMQDKALESWLQELVVEGKITGEEAGQYLEWWQARPEVELPGPRGHGPGNGGGMIRGGMWGGGFQRWGGPCWAPDASDEAGA